VKSTTQSAAPGVDLAAVSDWMDSIGLESGPVTAARAIGGGTRNIMMRFTRGTRDFVLRLHRGVHYFVCPRQCFSSASHVRGSGHHRYSYASIIGPTNRFFCTFSPGRGGHYE
jgi:hypothetical protein